MKAISKLINESIFSFDDQKIKRIKYSPYNMLIAKNAWKQIANRYCNNLEITEYNKNIWGELIKYIHGDDDCIYDLTKAIGLIGRTGSGKSMTMQIMNNYMMIDMVKYLRDDKLSSFNFKIFNARQIISDYSEQGYSGIEKYKHFNNICIDDLGNESDEANYYGTKLNVIEEIIEFRYLKNKITHFTSNMDLNGILEKYGDRVYSRLVHKTNIFVMNDKDFRLKCLQEKK